LFSIFAASVLLLKIQLISVHLIVANAVRQARAICGTLLQRRTLVSGNSGVVLVEHGCRDAAASLGIMLTPLSYSLPQHLHWTF